MGNRWENSGNSVRLYFFWGGGSKITADGDCSHEIKRLLIRGDVSLNLLGASLHYKKRLSAKHTERKEKVTEMEKTGSNATVGT